MRMTDAQRQQCVDDIAEALGTKVELRMDSGQNYYSRGPDFPWIPALGFALAIVLGYLACFT